MGIENFLVEEEKFLSQYIILNEYNLENVEIRNLFVEKLKDHRNNLLNYQNIIDKWIEELKDDKYINMNNLMKKVSFERERMIYLNKLKLYQYEDIINEIKTMINNQTDELNIQEYIENNKLLLDNDYLYESIINDENNELKIVDFEEEFEEDYDY